MKQSVEHGFSPLLQLQMCEQVHTSGDQDVHGNPATATGNGQRIPILKGNYYENDVQFATHT